MDNNKLCNIRGSPFTKMSHLRMLSLKNNKLTTLSEQAFEPIRSTMYRLDVEGNPLRCSCGLLWLQAWLKAIPQAGPRCRDGSLLKDFRLTRDNCAEPKYQDLIPGCEQNYHHVSASVPAAGTNWKDLKENKRPNAEDSEYFYEEYIEYEDNSSLPAPAVQAVTSSTVQTPVALIPASSTPSTTIPPGVLSHFIPGDTPTLYAGNSKPDDKTQGGPTFTFFGMPLPSLNLGKFWGSGRNAEGGIKGPKGRIQAVPAHPTPKVETGFTPVLNTGGFRPIFDPYSNKSDDGKTFEHNTASSEEHNVTVYSENTVTHTPLVTFGVISPTQKQIESPVTNNHKIVYERPDRQMHHELSIEKLPEKQSNDKPPNRHLEKIHDRGIKEKTPDKRVPDRKMNERPTDRQMYNVPKHGTNSVPNYMIPEKNRDVLTTHTTIVHGNIPTNINFMSTTTTSSVETSVKEKEEIVVNKGPASLSGFLAPGGQLPPYRVPGRPTITKVEGGITSSTGPSGPVAEEIHGSGPRSQSVTTIKPFTTTKITPILAPEPKLAWYFENYNNTNLEPYIGPGTDLMGFKPSSAGTTVKSLISVLSLLNIIHFIV